MAYNKTNWQSLPSTDTPISTGNLNKIENGIYDNSLKADQVGDLTELETIEKTTIVDAINEVNNKNIITELYNDSTGSNSTITLSESANDFEYIEIFFRYDTMYKSIKVYNPNNKYALLDFYDFSGNQLIFETKLVQISGTSITNTRYKHYSIADSSTWTPFGSNANNIYITRVIGYN